MGFFSNLTSAIVKTVLTPVAVVKDAANVVMGEEADSTKELLKSAGEDLEAAANNACGEDDPLNRQRIKP